MQYISRWYINGEKPSLFYTKRGLEQAQNLPVGAYEAGLEIQALHTILGDLFYVYISFTSICSSCDPRVRGLTIVDERWIRLQLVRWSVWMISCLKLSYQRRGPTYRTSWIACDCVEFGPMMILGSGCHNMSGLLTGMDISYQVRMENQCWCLQHTKTEYRTYVVKSLAVPALKI